MSKSELAPAVSHRLVSILLLYNDNVRQVITIQFFKIVVIDIAVAQIVAEDSVAWFQQMTQMSSCVNLVGTDLAWPADINISQDVL